MHGLCAIALISPILALCPAGGSAAVAPAAAAPAEAAGDLTELSLEQLMELPVHTVVTAAKHAQTTARAPALATVITAADIRDYGYRTLADVLRGAPGFYVTSDRGYGYLGVRGFGRPGDFGARVLLLLDGHRLNDPVYDVAPIMGDFVLDLDLIERVEIIRGPGSALYGSNAFFAVVNVITRQAPAERQIQAALAAGSYDTYRGRLSLAAGTASGTSFHVSASGLRSGGNPRVYFPEFDSRDTDYGLARDADGEELESFFGSLRRGGFTLMAAYNRREKDNPAPAYGTIFGLPTTTSDARALLDGRYQVDIREQLSGSVRAYWDWYDYWGHYLYAAGTAEDPAAILVNRDECHSESVGTDLQLNWRPAAQHGLTLGLEGRADLAARLRNYDVAPRTDYLSIDQSPWTLGAYLQHEFKPWPQLTILSGGRLDHYSTFGNAVNPRLACVYAPSATTTAKLLYGSAFRAPNVSEFFYQDDGLSTKLNAGLNPERVRTAELAVERQFGRRWRGSLSAFRSTVLDLINVAQDPADELYYFDNLDRVDARGIEAALEGIPARFLQTKACYTLAQTEDHATGRALANSPVHLAKLQLLAPLRADRLRAGLELLYMSSRRTEAGERMADLWLANGSLVSRLPGGGAELSLSVHNLFDTPYSDPAYSPDAIEQDGRTLRVKVTRNL